MPPKGSLRTNQWSPADASSHKFRAARRDAAPASSDAPAAASLASWLTSIFTCAAASGPKTRAGGLYERQHVDARQHSRRSARPARRRGRALSRQRHRTETPAAAAQSSRCARRRERDGAPRSPFPHTETRECPQARERALGHRQREGRAASVARRPHGQEIKNMGQGPRVDYVEIHRHCRGSEAAPTRQRWSTSVS